MIGDFGANRKAIQNALYEIPLIEKIEEDEYVISENKSTASLKELVIKNIPISSNDYGEKAFWVLNLEQAQSLFSAPQGFKTVEKIILFFTCSRLYILMLEMKSTLQPFDHGSGVSAIHKKVKDSMTRLATLLPYFVFDNRYKEIEELRFVALIVYNEDNFSPALNLHPKFRGHELELEEIFKKRKNQMFVQPDLGKTHPVTFKFLQNSNKGNSPESMEIDLREIFSDKEGADYDFPTASDNEFHFPRQ
jgi:hypothetical protein